jgi:hypothetical protein
MMATISYPAYGNGGLTVDQWSRMNTASDGVINNFDGNAWPLTIISATNTARLGAGTVRVNGYVLENDGDLDLAIPTAAGTYYIAACYDPTLNVAQTDGTANPSGPVRIVLQSALDTSNGKTYTLMRRLTRATAGGPVTALSWINSVGSVFSVPQMPTAKLTNPEGGLGGWDHPVGSQCLDRTTWEWYDKVPTGTPGQTRWRPRSVDGPYPFPAQGTLVAAAANEPATYTIQNNGAVVSFEGTLKRSNGASLSNGADVGLGVMPQALWPATQGRWSCVGKMPSRWATVQVTVGSDGVVALYDPVGFEIDWVDLSAISYRVKGR